MTRLLRSISFSALVATTLAANAASPFATSEDRAEPSADLPTHAAQAQGWGAPKRASNPATANTTVTEADVGDVDSFGRNLHWLGVTDMAVELSSDCSGADPSIACQTLAPAPATTTFDFEDLNHITLPEKAANSLLCYWLSPLLTVGYGNPTASTVVANLRINPTLTVENPLLSTPGLIDPTTGLPFGGQLLTGMTSAQRFEIPLPAATHITERTRDSAVCIAGLISRDTLVRLYGLSDAQARDFFRHDMTLRLNVAGSAQYVDSATIYFGWRLVGD